MLSNKSISRYHHFTHSFVHAAHGVTRALVVVQGLCEMLGDTLRTVTAAGVGQCANVSITKEGQLRPDVQSAFLPVQARQIEYRLFLKSGRWEKAPLEAL